MKKIFFGGFHGSDIGPGWNIFVPFFLFFIFGLFGYYIFFDYLIKNEFFIKILDFIFLYFDGLFSQANNAPNKERATVSYVFMMPIFPLSCFILLKIFTGENFLIKRMRSAGFFHLFICFSLCIVSLYSLFFKGNMDVYTSFGRGSEIKSIGRYGGAFVFYLSMNFFFASLWCSCFLASFFLKIKYYFGVKND